MICTLERSTDPFLAMHRRQVLTGGLALAGVLAAGCGKPADDRRAPATTDPGSSAVTPPSPIGQEVVALDPWLTLPTLHRLGLDVVGTFANGSFPAWLAPEVVDGVMDLGGYATPNLEALTVLAPDAIVGFDGTLDALPAAITEIAPTHALAFTGMNAGWRDGMRSLADLAGRPGELDEAIAELDGRADELRAEGEGGDLRSAALVRVRPDEIRLHGATHFGSSLLVDTGFSLPAAAPPITDLERGYVTISPEEVGLVDSDVLFVVVGGGGQDEGADDAMATLEANPLWQRLPAVTAGRVTTVGEHWAAGELTAADLVLDDIAAALARG